MKEENKEKSTKIVVREDGLILPTDAEIANVLAGTQEHLRIYEETCLVNARVLIEKYAHDKSGVYVFCRDEQGAGRHHIKIFDEEVSQYFLLTPEEEPDATYQLSVHHKEFLSMKYIYNMVEKLRNDINDLSAILGILPSKKATVRYYDLTQKI